ncbi:hypothetical protein ITP53_01715 [Nonomuraea sp. K274]|uniref:Uncharacterized protein n=1 Tax=Nonomuraea cypriaca TaxID=1187855 RepID=A0A931A1I2_9ACTN|nr:family 3 encapsulin nanocompartment shell protein [Nonomuraea cypriaca]MBF8184481.1 hypothetical protein [Nonomuraea cypriaca]
MLTTPGLETEATPGGLFASAVAEGAASVPFRSHLPAAFPLFATRPRYTVRHLLRTADVADEPYTFVYEPPQGELGAAGTSYAATPEAAFAPRLAQARLTDLSVTMPIPGDLIHDPALLAHYIDFRVLVRLSVVENESLLHGTADGAITGLLAQPGTRHTRTGKTLEEAVTTAAALVEETGGSCDGIVAHPAVYWELVRLGALSRLATAGIKVSRTRMIPRDRLLLGDFSAAATLLLPGVADITLDGPTVRATTRVGLAVRLPQHLMTLSWGGDHG